MFSSLNPILQDGLYNYNQAKYIHGTYRMKFLKKMPNEEIDDNTPEIIEKVVDLREPNNDYINNINNKYKEKRSIGIQTLFRESSTQTDPASNLGQIERDGSFLEILELDSLSYGKGLPVSMYEIELISKMREKRAFNDALPPLSDESCFNLRRKITQEQEVREWASTEKEYKNENNKRLLKLQNILEKKEKDSEENRLKKIEELKTIKEEEVESFIIKTRKLRVKIIRQTGKQKENFNKKEKYKRDIIMEYASYGSKVYAPFTRDGSNPDRNSFKFEIQNDFLLKDFKGLNYLEQNLQKKNMLNPKSKPDDIISNSESNNKSTAYNSFSNDFNKLEDVSFNKYESNHIKALNNAFESIVKAENQKLLEKQLEEEKNREIMKKKEEKKAVEVKSNDVDYIEEIMLIQRLLKGRKEQNLMYKGKLKRRELIKELREADSYKQMSEETNVNISESNKYDNKINYYDKLTNSLIDAIQGNVVSNTLDKLSKEKTRINQESIINSIVNKAEDERRKREAVEMGKRQAEHLIRSRQDVLYKDLLVTNKSTMDSYINYLFAENVNKVAKKQVMREIEIKAKKLNTIVDKIEGEFIKDDITVKNLVSTFIIPEIDRKKLEDKKQSEEKRFIEKSKYTIKNSTFEAAKELYSIAEDKEEN